MIIDYQYQKTIITNFGKSVYSRGLQIKTVIKHYKFTTYFVFKNA